MYIKRKKTYKSLNIEHNLNDLKYLSSVWEAENLKPGTVFNITAVIL